MAYVSTLLHSGGKYHFLPLVPLSCFFYEMSHFFVISTNKQNSGKISLFLTYDAILFLWSRVFSRFLSCAFTVNENSISKSRTVKTCFAYLYLTFHNYVWCICMVYLYGVFGQMKAKKRKLVFAEFDLLEHSYPT